MILGQKILERAPGRLVLGGAPGWRLLFGLIAAGLAAGMAATADFSLVLAAAALVSAAAALWEEGWIAERESGLLRRRRGFWPFVREERIPFAELRRLSLRVAAGPDPRPDPRNGGGDTHIPELLKKGRAVLVVQVGGGGAMRSEIVDEGSHRERERLEGLGRALAEATGAEFQGCE